MNSLHVGTGLTIDWLRSKAEPPYLLIANRAEPFLAKRSRVFDPARHSFNPLIRITPERAVDIADIIYASDPGGEATGNFVTQSEFWPVKVLVYGCTGMMLTGVIGALLYLVIKH